MKRSKKRFLNYFLNIFLVFIILICVFSIFFNANYSSMVVIGKSMYPTLKEGEFGYANHSTSRLKKLKRGEIILFHPNNDVNSIYIKRIIALPGDTFYLDSSTNEITINGVLFEQNFISDEIRKQTCTTSRKFYNADQEITLNETQYFVLGDNRPVSLDSAHGIGFAEQKNIIGVLEMVLATCNLQSDSNNGASLNVCSFNKRNYYNITDWKYF